VVYTVNSTSNFAVGDHVIVSGLSGASRSVLYSGASEVTSVNSGNSTVTCNFFKPHTHLDPSGSLTSGNITIFKTVIDWNVDTAITVLAGAVLNINKVGMDGVDLTCNGIYAYGGGEVIVGDDGMSMIRMDDAFQALYGSYMRCNNTAAGRCVRCYYVGYDSYMEADDSIASAATGSAINVTHGSTFICNSMYNHGGDSHGMVVSNARSHGSDVGFWAFYDHGCIWQQGSQGHHEDSFWNWNQSRGFLAQFGCFVEFSGCDIISNTSTGAYFYENSSGRCSTGNISYNGGGGSYCGYNSNLWRSGTSYIGNTSWSYSPSPLNAVGNVESFTS
jgi:hypothetical protein